MDQFYFHNDQFFIHNDKIYFHKDQFYFHKDHGQLKLRPYFLPWVSKNRRYVSTIQSLFWILFTWILLFFTLNLTSLYSKSKSKFKKRTTLRGKATLPLWNEPSHDYVGLPVTEIIYGPVGLCFRPQAYF